MIDRGAVLYQDRHDAGRTLAAHLLAFADRPGVVVLGLPRGGVPVAYEVAYRLKAPLDVFTVRKLGVPGHEELAMGALASGGTCVLDTELIAALHVPPQAIDAAVRAESAELERREGAYRDHRVRPNLAGKTVIVVDDGLATGASMIAAVRALRQRLPKAIVVAVPVGARETVRQLLSLADDVVCAATPEPFRAVGLHYADFTQTSDEEVRRLLLRAEVERSQWHVA